MLFQNRFQLLCGKTSTGLLYTIRVTAPLKPYYVPVFRGKRLFLGGDKNGEKMPKK
jgi:hypothetical protein